jgi:hypothetical protein
MDAIEIPGLRDQLEFSADVAVPVAIRAMMDRGVIAHEVTSTLALVLDCCHAPDVDEPTVELLEGPMAAWITLLGASVGAPSTSTGAAFHQEIKIRHPDLVTAIARACAEDSCPAYLGSQFMLLSGVTDEPAIRRGLRQAPTTVPGLRTGAFEPLLDRFQRETTSGCRWVLVSDVTEIWILADDASFVDQCEATLADLVFEW